ncbi:UdgX family uracil-DNA binding protein [Brevundimonas halotolerans]|uniref:Type-4 uracil-DNA glycosylase n=1 Tax=Brevundimonas halotolerans TaxID=69670 RepID=A0A7W9A4S3_9CAUL|nr:UdgX family uracil-DNA binding protein [Brevundimonas halotolerans]MBB5661436.1 DNA polymerase [Brevundimonas halotolerans]
MRSVHLASETDLEGWREAARGLLVEGVEPAAVRFRAGDAQGSLFDQPDRLPPVPRNTPLPVLSVPRAFLDLVEQVALHRSEDRFDLLYRLLWRLQRERALLHIASDRDVADAMERAKNVSRAAHKMKAFVRFRRIEDEDGEHWIAWFEPAHRVLERTAPFFQRRFTTMRWTILTPDGTAHWDLERLSFGPPAMKDQAPDGDDVEEFWKTYYASTFNPARLKTKMMQSEMPRRYWANLPEAALIPGMIREAEARLGTMVATPASPANARLMKAIAPVVQRPEPVSAPDSLAALSEAAQACRRCPLWRDATQAVCGKGPARADLMIVGEQPGDQEDLAGEPFVGPAGQVLDAALAEAGLDRDRVWITNAVKHFKHEPRGKRRLHKTPDAGEVEACRWWLDAERALVKPRLIVTLGATAALGVLGHKIAVTKDRGRPIRLEDGTPVLPTVHPSYLLRLPDEATRAAERARFIDDLKTARALL